ncbi:hypothetical protein, partial [Haemophilus influenzae]|uniref:hypothetical protein n=1 Tax=Haemophilus influenzae TaxID=727 RepID=UPI001C636602
VLAFNANAIEQASRLNLKLVIGFLIFNDNNCHVLNNSIYLINIKMKKYNKYKILIALYQ